MNKTLEGVSMEIPMQCSTRGTCSGCPLVSGVSFAGDCKNVLASEVQRLRDEREKNPGVWDGAPIKADEVQLWFYNGRDLTGKMIRRCRIRKTIEQEIAEKYATENGNYCQEVADKIERAITEFNGRTK